MKEPLVYMVAQVAVKELVQELTLLAVAAVAMA
jgi:hypothetical protein